MSRLLDIRARIEKATEHQRKLSNRIKKLRKHARDLSIQTQSDADRLAGRAVCALATAGLPLDSAAVVAKAREVAGPSGVEALEALVERMTEHADNTATSVTEAKAEANLVGPSTPSKQSTAPASTASRPSASTRAGNAEVPVIATPDGVAPVEDPQTADAARPSAANSDASSAQNRSSYMKPLRRLV
jgi:hypothetical protein